MDVWDDYVFKAGVSATTFTGALAGNATTATTAAAWTTARTVTFTGGITGSFSIDGSANVGSVALTIASNTVTLAMMANMATGSLLYRKTAGSGAPEVQALSILKADLGLTGTNSGDQTTITGNAGTATALQTTRTFAITGDGAASAQNFNGTANVSLTLVVTKLNGVTLSSLGTGILKNTTGTGAPSIAVAGDFPTLNQSTTGSAATLTTPRAINGVNFDGSAAISVNATSGTPADLASTAALGSSGLAARSDHVHKAPGASYVTGALGSNFSITTTSYASTGLSIALPAAGIYRLTIQARLLTTSGFGTIFLRLYNTTTAASVGDVIPRFDNFGLGQTYLLELPPYVAAGAHTLRLDAAVGVAVAGQTLYANDTVITAWRMA